MKKYLFLFILFFGFYSCSKERKSIIPPPVFSESDKLLIKHDGIVISDSEALKIAAMFFSNNFSNETKNINRNKVVKSIETVIDKDANSLMYVVNFEPTGFIIISATKNYAPILAYSDDSRFVLEENNGTKIWLDEIKQAISLSDRFPAEEIFRNRVQWLKYEQSVTEEEVATKSGTASQAFYDRISQLRNSYPGYNFYPLSNVGPSMFPLSNTYDDLCRLANGYNSPLEYTIVGIKSNDKYNIIGPLLKTEWH